MFDCRDEYGHFDHHKNNSLISETDQLSTDNSKHFSHPGKFLGHRRMRSHPEYICRQKDMNGQSPSNKNMSNLYPQIDPKVLFQLGSNIRSVRTSPQQMDLLNSPRANEESSNTLRLPSRHKSYETHRRLLSASEAVRPSNVRHEVPETPGLINSSRTRRKQLNFNLAVSFLLLNLILQFLCYIYYCCCCYVINTELIYLDRVKSKLEIYKLKPHV